MTSGTIFGARELYLQNNNLSQNPSSKSKNKITTKGMSFTKRLETKEPKYNPHHRRFIRKGKTFQAFPVNQVIKLESLVVSFAKSKCAIDGDLASQTEANTAAIRTKVINIRPFSRMKDTDVPLTQSGATSVAAIRVPAKKSSQKRAKNMHILDMEKEIAQSKAQKSQYSVSLGSHKNVNKSQGSFRCRISPNEPKEYTLEEMKSLFAIDVRPFSSNYANSNSENNLLTTSASGYLHVDVKSKGPIYSSSRLFSKDPSYLGRVKTADATALRPQMSREFTINTKESSHNKVEVSRERTNKSAIRPMSGMPTYSKRRIEGSDSDLAIATILNIS